MGRVGEVKERADRQRQTDRDSQSPTDRARDSQRQPEPDRDRDRQRQTEPDRDRQRQTEADMDRQRQTETDRDRTPCEVDVRLHMLACQSDPPKQCQWRVTLLSIIEVTRSEGS